MESKIHVKSLAVLFVALSIRRILVTATSLLISQLSAKLRTHHVSTEEHCDGDLAAKFFRAEIYCLLEQDDRHDQATLRAPISALKSIPAQLAELHRHWV